MQKKKEKQAKIKARIQNRKKIENGKKKILRDRQDFLGQYVDMSNDIYK
jgi:hypothetical protein